MKHKSFETFYFQKDGSIRKIEEINEAIKSNNYNPFYGEMFCPECCLAELKYTPEYSNKKAYLSAIRVDTHHEECSYKYEPADNKAISQEFDHLTEEQTQDKLEAVLLYLKRINLFESKEKTKHSLQNTTNPLLLNEKKSTNKQTRYVLPKRILNRELKKTDAAL